MPALLRYLWAAPSTFVGLLAALATAHRARVRLVDGVLECHGPGVARALGTFTRIDGHSATAITLGHVVLGCDQPALDAARAHEHVHVRQYERWGPFFIPAYMCASARAALHGRHPYFDNAFERQAFRAAAGEPPVPSSAPVPRHRRARLC